MSGTIEVGLRGCDLEEEVGFELKKGGLERSRWLRVGVWGEGREERLFEEFSRARASRWCEFGWLTLRLYRLTRGGG